MSETDEDVEYFCGNPDCDEFGTIVDPLKQENGDMVCPNCGKKILDAEPDIITEKDVERISGSLYNALCSICEIFGLFVDDYIELEPEEKSWAELRGDYYG